jgi:hypothetical protein
MVNYYDILKVSPKASKAEIKSAYRRLARKLHPDSHEGSEETALRFAAIAEAYAVLGNSKDRAAYDRRILEIQYSTNGNADSVFASQNRHAKRWRQMVYEKRFNDIIDRLIAEERREAIALQRFIFPLVALGVGSIFIGIVRPNVFLSDVFPEWTGVLFKIFVASFFVIGIIHLVGRIRESFDRFAYDDDEIHDSILDETELPIRMMSRYAMSALIVAGIAVCIGIGFAIGYGLDLRSVSMPYLFSKFPQVDVLIFPPIFALLVDTIHSLILSSGH